MDRRTLLALAPLVTLFAREALAESAEPGHACHGARLAGAEAAIVRGRRAILV